MAILDSAERSGVGISTFVSLGNKIDVSTNDLLSYWYDDVTTRAVALYVESFGNPRRFTWLARALSTRKPILAVKSGRSTAAVAQAPRTRLRLRLPDVAVDTLFRQAGVLRMDTLGELLDAVRLLTEQPLPAGDRVAIVGNAGGLNVLAADAAAAAKLQVVELSAPFSNSWQTLRRIWRVSPIRWIWALMQRRRRSAGPFGHLPPQAKPTRWWSRWSPLAPMTCREHCRAVRSGRRPAPAADRCGRRWCRFAAQTWPTKYSCLRAAGRRGPLARTCLPVCALAPRARRQQAGFVRHRP